MGASAMFIYKSSKVLPYVYFCQEKNSPYFYIGYRYKNFLPSTEDFGKKYFTSNNYVKNNFYNFEHTIIAEFFNKADAYKFEQELVQKTKSEFQINSHRLEILKGAKYNKIPKEEPILRKCLLPECEKFHTNWRMKCCCHRHNNIYIARNQHKK